MLSEELENIVKSEKDIIPFLKKLSPSEKRELAPFLKKFHKKIFEFKYKEEKTLLGGISYTSSYTHTEKQRELTEMACYVCFNKTDVKQVLFNVSNLSVSDDYLENIIPWYTPKWFSDLINEQFPWRLEYAKAMQLYNKGLLELSDPLIRNILPRAIIEYKWDKKKDRQLSYYRPEQLLKYPETLKEHIWLLFEEESDINNYYNYNHIENYKERNDIWIDTIFNLVNDDKVDRNKTLITTIYTSTKGFNKNLSGWFFDLLVKLSPSNEETIHLQNEFFSALNSPHSKIINTVLKYFKKIANDKKFKYKVFIDNCSMLLNLETKSVVNSTLMILDKIAKTHKSSNTLVCKKVAEAFINIDEKIQLRAAKIIEKYGDIKNQELLDEVNMYTDNLFHSSKEVLKEYIVFFEEIEEEIYEENNKVLSEENQLSKYSTLDDLIFFVSQSIDNNEIYHIDLLLNYLPKLNILLNEESVVKMEPIFKRSFDLSISFDWNSQIGNLEIGAAYFINDFAEILMKKYPSKLENFRKVKKEKIKKLKEDRYFNSHYKNSLKEIEYQSIPDYIYQVHHFLFLKSKHFIKNDLNLDMLSTPTHVPCWIAPKVLVERIISYEKTKEEIDLYDFQIAIGRLPINEDLEEIIEQLDKIKDRDIKQVLKYHYGQLEIQGVDLSRPELWIQSVLSRNKDAEIKYFQEYLSNPLKKEMGAYDWNCSIRNHFYKEYDYRVGKKVEKKMVRKELKFKDFNSSKKENESIVSNVINIFSKKKTKEVGSIYQYMYFEKQKYYTTIQPNDDVKFLFLSPNNPSMFLSHVIHNNLKESTFFDESSKKNMVNLLKGLYEVWYRKDFGRSTYLFLATGFLCSNKVARELAAEIWIKANYETKINNQLLGEILGGLQKGEYAPLKRFTDLLTANLFNVSKKHNESLFYLLSIMISNLGNEPLRGTKKLLEIFLELRLDFPQKEIDQSLQEKLSEWKKTNSLKQIINKI